MAEGNEPRPYGYNTEYITFDQTYISASFASRKKTYGNVVFLTGNITTTNAIPETYADTLISTDVPVINDNYSCAAGLIRFDDGITGIMVITNQGLCLNTRGQNLKNKQGIFFATYIASD